MEVIGYYLELRDTGGAYYTVKFTGVYFLTISNSLYFYYEANQ